MSSCVRLYAGFYCNAKFLYKELASRSCDHDVPRTARFCSECGMPRVTGENIPIDGYAPRRKRITEVAGVYSSFDVYEVCYNYRLDQPEAFIVGRYLGVLAPDHSIAPVSPQDVEGLPTLFAQLRSDPRIARAMLLSSSCYTAPSMGLYMFPSE